MRKQGKILIGVIIIILIGISMFYILTANNNPKNNNANQSINNTQVTNLIKIQKVDITTGHSLASKSRASIFIGSQHAGKTVKVTTDFSREKTSLNHNETTQETVSPDGYINITCAEAYSKYPDTCVVTVSDNSTSDCVTCNLKIESGTQTNTF